VSQSYTRRQTLLTLIEMQQEQPQFYSSLAGHLTADDQNVIQSVMVKADEIAAQQVQQAQQAQLLAQQQAAAMAANLSAPNGGAS
jgi:importin-7